MLLFSKTATLHSTFYVVELRNYTKCVSNYIPDSLKDTEQKM